MKEVDSGLFISWNYQTNFMILTTSTTFPPYFEIWTRMQKLLGDLYASVIVQNIMFSAY